MKTNTKGIIAALSSALFLGLAPVFGRQAILLGLAPLAVVAIRTALAALMMLAVIALFYRPFLFIYPAGLLGCLIAGWINGFGSLFYYSALGRINAGLGQLLYALYPLFLVLWLALDQQRPSRLTLFRLALAIPAIVLLLQVRPEVKIDPIGVVEMLIASALYALHLPFNQRVLYDMPAPTVTLYTLLAMSAVTVPVFLFSGVLAVDAADTGQMAAAAAGAIQRGWFPVLGLSLVTFFSRIMLFLGVKHLGGMQTALLGLGELLVTVVFAYLVLGEQFSAVQWAGAALLGVSLALVGFEKNPPRARGAGGFLSWMGSSRLTSEGWQPHD
ncbi:MAG: DMT family transporter [Chloroflexota bacterium]